MCFGYDICTFKVLNYAQKAFQVNILILKSMPLDPQETVRSFQISQVTPLHWVNSISMHGPRERLLVYVVYMYAKLNKVCFAYAQTYIETSLNSLKRHNFYTTISVVQMQ